MFLIYAGPPNISKKNSKIIWVWTVPKKNYYDFPNVWTVSELEENHKGRVKLWPQRGWDLTARSHFGPATMLLPSTGKSPYLLFIVHTCVHTLPTLRTYIPTYLDTCIPNMPTYLPTYRIRTYIHNRIFTYAQRKCVKYKRINKYITNIIYIMYIYIYLFIFIYSQTQTPCGIPWNWKTQVVEILSASRCENIDLKMHLAGEAVAAENLCWKDRKRRGFNHQTLWI